MRNTWEIIRFIADFQMDGLLGTMGSTTDIKYAIV
jgi:hypothetical protein